MPSSPGTRMMSDPQGQEGDAKAHQLALAQAKTQSGGKPGAEQITGQRHEQHADGAGTQLEHVPSNTRPPPRTPRGRQR